MSTRSRNLKRALRQAEEEKRSLQAENTRLKEHVAYLAELVYGDDTLATSLRARRSSHSLSESTGVA